MKKRIIILSIIVTIILTISFTIFYYKQKYHDTYNSFEYVDRSVTTEDIRELGYGDIPIYQELKLNNEFEWGKKFK